MNTDQVKELPAYHAAEQYVTAALNEERDVGIVDTDERATEAVAVLEQIARAQDAVGKHRESAAAPAAQQILNIRNVFNELEDLLTGAESRVLKQLSDFEANGARRFEPLDAEHPLVTGDDLCPGCKQPFTEGDVTTLVSVGPGDDPEARKRATEGRAYTGVAIPAHYACVTGISDETAEELEEGAELEQAQAASEL